MTLVEGDASRVLIQIVVTDGSEVVEIRVRRAFQYDRVG